MRNSGGTLSGIGRYFKEHRPSVRIVAVDPKGSLLGPYFRTHELVRPVPYQVEGIGEDMIPKTIHYQYLDEFVEVEDRESFLMARRLAHEEGLFVGGSSGSAVAGALRWLSDRPLPDGATVVIVLPDSGDRYLSKFYSDEWLREKGHLDAGSTVADLLKAKSFTPALVSADPTTLIRDALATLRRYGISQLPVLAGNLNVGSIQEEDILRSTIEDQTVAERTVAAVLGPKFAEVALDTSVGEIVKRLREERALLVRDGASGQAIGLVTRHDLLEFLSHRGSPP